MTLPAITGRRALLGFLAASPAVLAIPTPYEARPDAELLELARKHEASRLAATRLWEAASARDDAARTALPPLPEALKVCRDDTGGRFSGVDIGRPLSALEIAAMRLQVANADTPGFIDYARRQTARAREAVAAAEAHRAVIEAVYVAHGVREAEALSDAAWRVTYDLGSVDEVPDPQTG
jgi:hypothetical protein